MAAFYAQYAERKCDDNGKFLPEGDLNRLDDIYRKNTNYQLGEDVDWGHRDPEIKLRTKVSIYVGC